MGIDDIQEYAVDSFEDLASSADSFVTTELDSDATVFDTPYGDVSFGVDLQSMDGSTPEISDFEVTPLDSVPGVEYRSSTSQRHHVSSQLRVSERDIAIACQHFDAARQLLAVYGWGSPTSDEQGGSYLSLTEIHSLWEAIRILRQDYMQLVADRDYLMEWGSTAYDALLVKEDEVSELTQQLEGTSEILESTQLAFEESQFHLAEVTRELERLQTLPDSVQSQIVVSGDPRMSMVEVDRGSRDEDISVLDTSIGMFGSFPLEASSVELGVAVEHCSPLNMVVIPTTDGMEDNEVVSGISCGVGEPAVGMVPASDTTPLALSSEIVVSSSLVSDWSQLVSSGVQSESLTEIGASYRHYTVRYAHQFTFDDHVDDMMVRRYTLVPSACHQLWDGMTLRDESCDEHYMVISSAVDSLIVHDLEQECGSITSTVVVIDSTPLAMSSPDIVGDQSQWVVSPVHGEMLIEVGPFYQHYTAGYVHQLAFDPCVEQLMAVRFGLGSSSCYLSCDDYSPSAVHGSYGYETVVGELQSCFHYRSCTVCGFSILSAVSFGSVHHCCRVGLCILHRPVGCVDGIFYVGSLSCPLYLGSDISRVCFSWVPDCDSCDSGVCLSCICQFDYGILLIIFQRTLQELALIDSSVDHDYIWDPGGLVGLLFSHCLGTSNFRKGGLSCPHFG